MAEVGFKRPASYVGTLDGYLPKRMRTRSGRTYVRNARAAAASRIQRSYRRYRQSRTVRRPMTVGGAGVTSEHDRQTLYRIKPRRKNKAWQKFKKKVHFVGETDLGSRTCVFSTRDKQYTNQVVGEHCVLWCGLYGLNSSQSVYNDLRAISQLENQGNPTASGGDRVGPNAKYIFKSAIIDITIRNSSQKVVGWDALFNPIVELSDATLETDVYEIMMGKQGYDNVNGNVFQSIQDFFTVADGDTPGIGGALVANQVSIVKRGVTPFDMPFALKDFKMKIMKKTKYFIRPGNTITYQYRDTKRRVTSGVRMAEDPGCNKPGWTKHIFVIAKATPGNKVGPWTYSIGEGNLNNSSEQLTLGCTRKYLYKIEGVNETRDYYVSQT